MPKVIWIRGMNIHDLKWMCVCFLMLSLFLLVFITSRWSLDNKLRQNKALLFLKCNSPWNPICFRLNETGMPYQLSRCHFFWQLQDTLFTSAEECSAEGHLSFCEMERQRRKYFYCYRKWFICKRRWDVSERQRSKQVIWDLNPLNLQWKKGCFNYIWKKDNK